MEFLLLNKEAGKAVAHIQLNRPKQLNAIHYGLLSELATLLRELDQDDSVRAIVISGNERAFAAGADIKAMANAGAIDMYKMDLESVWRSIYQTKKPMIAAVSGFALGGGCELVMACDMVIASETARLGQPEIKLGIIPGAGGTQRLARLVGKARAMELVLTGRFITPKEALGFGMINKIAPVELYLQEAIQLATTIAAMAPIAVQLAKESILNSANTSLTDGLAFERKNFYQCFATEDQKEGMKAFIEKRPATFFGK